MSMASPFPAAASVIKVDDEENRGVPGRVPSDQELRNKFWEEVRRRVELGKRGLSASGSAQPPPPLPPPVRHKHDPSLPPFQNKACEFCITKSWSEFHIKHVVLEVMSPQRKKGRVASLRYSGSIVLLRHEVKLLCGYFRETEYSCSWTAFF